MTVERRARPSETAIWSILRSDADDGAIEALWAGLTAHLDATPQKSRRILDWPWAGGLPGVPGFRLPTPGPALAVAALVALLTTSVVVGLVASAHRLPPPIGLAKPGQIAFDDAGDIVVANADGTGRRSLTSGPTDDVQPTWSPDGTRIAFWSLPPGEAFARLVVVDPDGSRLRTVASKDVSFDVSGVRTLDPYDIAWSPDDRSLAFTGGVSQDHYIVIASADGTGSSVVGDRGFDSQTPTWSPDGTKIAFRGGRSDRDRGIYVMDADGSDRHRLTADLGSDWGGTYSWLSPVWSPDGREIAFTRAAGPPYAASPDGGSPLRIWVVDADGGNERMMSYDDYDNDSPVWSPDGSRIAYRQSLEGVKASTVVVKTDGSDPILLARESDASVPHWSPDGTSVVSTVATDDGSSVDILVSSIASRATMRFPASTTDARTDIGGGDLSWQRLAP